MANNQKSFRSRCRPCGRTHTRTPLAVDVQSGASPPAWSTRERKKGNEQQVAYVTEYFVKAEAELPEIHDGILALMDERLILSARCSTTRPTSPFTRVVEEIVEVVKQEISVLTATIEEKMGRQGDWSDEVEKLKSFPADKEQASKLDGSCAAHAPEWEEIQRLRAEGLVAVRDFNKLPNDSDSHELFKGTLLSPSVMHVQIRVTGEESSAERVPWSENHQGHQPS